MMMQTLNLSTLLPCLAQGGEPILRSKKPSVREKVAISIKNNRRAIEHLLMALQLNPLPIVRLDFCSEENLSAIPFTMDDVQRILFMKAQDSQCAQVLHAQSLFWINDRLGNNKTLEALVGTLSVPAYFVPQGWKSATVREALTASNTGHDGQPILRVAESDRTFGSQEAQRALSTRLLSFGLSAAIREAILSERGTKGLLKLTGRKTAFYPGAVILQKDYGPQRLLLKKHQAARLYLFLAVLLYRYFKAFDASDAWAFVYACEQLMTPLYVANVSKTFSLPVNLFYWLYVEGIFGRDPILSQRSVAHEHYPQGLLDYFERDVILPRLKVVAAFSPLWVRDIAHQKWILALNEVIKDKGDAVGVWRSWVEEEKRRVKQNANMKASQMKKERKSR